MHFEITREGRSPTPLLALRWHTLISQELWNALRWVIGVEFEDALGYGGRCLEAEIAIWID